MKIGKVYIWLLFGPILWTIFLCLVFRNFEYSGLYTFNREQADLVERKRLQQSLHYLEHLRNVSSQRLFDNLPHGENVSLCIAIQSMYRKSSYLTQTIAFLLYRLLHEGIVPKGKVVDVCVYNGNDPPEAHTELAEDGAISSLVRVVIPRLNASTTLPTYLNEFEMWRSRERLQYAHILQSAFEDGCPWLIVLEDDAIISRDFVAQIHGIQAQVSKTQKVAYIKLFFSEALKGWENEPDDYFTIVSLGLAISGVCAYFTHKLPFSNLAFWTKVRAILFMTFYFLPATVMSLWIIGKQYIIRPFLRGLTQTHDHAYTVGQLYPRHALLPAARYLREDNQNQPVDLSLGSFVETERWSAFLQVPNIVQHIGMYSSNPLKKPGEYLHRTYTFGDEADILSR